MYGLARGTSTLAGVGVAGLLLWLAGRLDADVNGEYWARAGLLAAAGLAVALSQLLGGWTKWGWPRITVPVLLLGFLPALVAGGLVLLHAQPDGGAFGAGWAGDLGVGGLADDLGAVVPAIALGLGLALGLTFDTAGPRMRAATAPPERAEPEPGYAGPVPPEAADTTDEPTTAERREAARADEEPVERTSARRHRLLRR